MKKKLTLVILSSIFIVTAFLLVLHIRNKSVVVDLFTNKEVNLGNVKLDSKKDFEVPLINLTGKDFEIAKVYTSCGCTRVIGEESGVTAFTIKGGETTNVKFEFDPSSMHQLGDSINHVVYFLVTNPIEKEYEVKITGRVI